MDSTKLTSLLGYAQAAGTAAITFYATARQDGTVDFTNWVFWAGLAVAVIMALKAHYTQGIPASGQVMATKTDPEARP